MPSTDRPTMSAFSIYKKAPTQTIVKMKKKHRLRGKKRTNLNRSNNFDKTPEINEAGLEMSEDDEPPQLVEVVPEAPSDNGHEINDDPSVEALQLFKWLMAPIAPSSFYERYWESKPVHVKRTQNNYYSHILDTAGLDKMLRENSLWFTRNVDVVTYENGVKEVLNQEGHATPSALWDFYSNGCSIRILNPHTYSHKIHLLISTLQEYFGTMVGANIYLTPPNSQGFAPHYDDIEAFVIQLEGRKHWKLYQPQSSDVLARDSSGNFKQEDLPEPFMELTLEAGEILYFPRGTIHEGRTDEESHSLHITVSVYQHSAYADLLEHILPEALKKAAQNNVEFRKGLPLNYLKSFGATHPKHPKKRNLVMAKIKSLLEILNEYVDIDGAADQLGRKFMRDAMPPVLSKSEIERSVKGDGPVMKNGKVSNSVEIGPDTKIRLLRYYCLRVVIDGGSPKLYYNTENAAVYHGEEEQWLELEPRMIPAISVLQNKYPKYIQVEELPLKDTVLKMQLVSDLWERGLLVSEHPLDCVDEEEVS